MNRLMYSTVSDMTIIKQKLLLTRIKVNPHMSKGNTDIAVAVITVINRAQ